MGFPEVKTLRLWKPTIVSTVQEAGLVQVMKLNVEVLGGCYT